MHVVEDIQSSGITTWENLDFANTVQRVRNILQYQSPEDCTRILMDEGISPDNAFLLTQAASI